MRRVAVLLLVLALTLAGCREDVPDPVNPTAAPASPVVGIDWANRPTEPVQLDDGFSAAGCEGDAPFLCLSRQGEVVGTIEYFSFQAPAEGPAGVLEDLVEDDYETFDTDRSATCPEGYEVATVNPKAAEVGGNDGLRSEYYVNDAGGRTVERYVKYWTIDGGRVHLISAEAQEEGSCSPGEGAVFRNDVLTAFEPSFAGIARGSKFPEESG